MSSFAHVLKRGAWCLLTADMLALTFVMAWAGVFAAIGIFLSNSNKDAFIVLREVMPLAVWAFLFLLYGGIKFTRALCTGRDMCRYAGSILGIVLWACLLATAPTAPIFDPMKLLYTVPLLVDVWMLGQVIGGKRIDTKGLKYEPARN
jgi:hypothetical protein